MDISRTAGLAGLTLRAAGREADVRHCLCKDAMARRMMRGTRSLCSDAVGLLGSACEAGLPQTDLGLCVEEVGRGQALPCST